MAFNTIYKLIFFFFYYSAILPTESQTHVSSCLLHFATWLSNKQVEIYKTQNSWSLQTYSSSMLALFL